MINKPKEEEIKIGKISKKHQRNNHKNQIQVRMIQLLTTKVK